jgi:hypothetical protein
MKAVDKEMKKLFLQSLFEELLKAYDSEGLTVSDYYKNIMLPDLTHKEFLWLEEAAGGEF